MNKQKIGGVQKAAYLMKMDSIVTMARRRNNVFCVQRIIKTEMDSGISHVSMRVQMNMRHSPQETFIVTQHGYDDTLTNWELLFIVSVASKFFS